MKMPKTVLDHYSYGKALAELDNTRKELETLRKKVLDSAQSLELYYHQHKSSWAMAIAIKLRAAVEKGDGK